jgi:hypothetical protein
MATVLANFGGTYESVQTDERREFTAMLAFVGYSAGFDYRVQKSHQSVPLHFDQ